MKEFVPLPFAPLLKHLEISISSPAELFVDLGIVALLVGGTIAWAQHANRKHSETLRRIRDGK